MINSLPHYQVLFIHTLSQVLSCRRQKLDGSICLSPRLYTFSIHTYAAPSLTIIFPPRSLFFNPHVCQGQIQSFSLLSSCRERILSEWKPLLMLSSLKASALPTVWCVLMLNILPLPLCSVSPAAGTLLSLQSLLPCVHHCVSPVFWGAGGLSLIYVAPLSVVPLLLILSVQVCCFGAVARLHQKPFFLRSPTNRAE